MDPVTGQIVGSVASSLLGGLFGGGGGSKAEWVTPNYAQIRKKAEAAGFNPLTALQSAAGGVGTSTTAPSFGQRLANGAADAFSAYSEGKVLQTELDQRERELQLKEKAAEALSQQERHTSGLVAKQAADVESLGSKFEGQNRSLPNIAPMLRPTAKSRGFVPVFNPSGGIAMLNALQAERLKLKNWDMMMVEDFEALGGDEAGQLMALPHMANIPEASFGGLSANSTEDFFGKTSKQKRDETREAGQESAYSAYENVFGY